jgi:hypothetical protein
MHLICCCHANPWLHVTLALEYMEHVVTTMSEISAVMTGRECYRGLEIQLINEKLHFGKRVFTYEGIIGIRMCNGLKVTDQP